MLSKLSNIEYGLIRDRFDSEFIRVDPPTHVSKFFHHNLVKAKSYYGKLLWKKSDKRDWYGRKFLSHNKNGDRVWLEITLIGFFMGEEPIIHEFNDGNHKVIGRGWEWENK